MLRSHNVLKGELGSFITDRPRCVESQTYRRVDELWQKFIPLYSSLAAEQMDQVSNRSGLGSDEITDESASMLDNKWSSEDDEVKQNKT